MEFKTGIFDIQEIKQWMANCEKESDWYKISNCKYVNIVKNTKQEQQERVHQAVG